ncbi:MAG: hypothetical protein VYC34_05925, partial [Planctomycetota bacterium]|nr:hypothetical protein [Planctomycetota bacterium]
AASKPHRRIVNLPGEDLYLFARLHDDMHAWVGLRADFSRGDRLTASVVSETSHDIDPVEPWPLERFQRLADPTLACFVERRAEMKPGEIPFGAPILAQIPWMNPNENLRPLLGDLQTLMITPAERGGVSVVAALQSTDINRLPAPGDDMMHSLVNRISTLLGGGAWDLNFNGLWPQAQRTVNLDIPDGAGLRYIAHGGARIQWRYAPDECPDSSAGWLVIATDQPQLDRAAQTLTADLADHEAARWISVGLIRPAALLKSLRAGGDPVEPGLDILSTVESCAWRMKCNGDRALPGEVEVRFPAK